MIKYFGAGLLAMTVRYAAAQPLNTVTPEEKASGWELLFDGSSTAGWHVYNNKTSGSAWKVKEGILYLDLADAGRGDLITDKEYENFELQLEWKLEPCGNSGVIFNAVESPTYKAGWNTGPEMQILDNNCHPDAKIIKHRAGNLYDLLASPDESVLPANSWNWVVISSDRGHLQMWLNDVKQVETMMFTPEWEELIRGSKFKAHPDFGKARKGHLLLQDHGNPVYFRNIKIRELKQAVER
ncbi:MAG: DUF1080 domain-containing protein [Cytophagales bacterium]|nr:DUF1080 domain-containing protein [Cytophagales bacterium]